MTKFISQKSLQTIKQFIPDLYEIGASRLFQLAVLQLTSKDLHWAYHPNIQSITSNKVNTTRLVVQTMFQNHLVDWEGIRTRKFDFEEYNKLDCIDLHAAFYRRFHGDTTDSKPEERKNIFVHCPNFSIQYFRYNNFLYRQHLNKIICMPHSKLPDLSPEIEEMCMKLNIKVLPMKECSYQSILTFIRNNYQGNILINGLIHNHDFILNSQSKLQPRQIMIFLDNEYSRRDKSKKVAFPSIQSLLDHYQVQDQYKIDNRMTFVDMKNIKAKERLKSDGSNTAQETNQKNSKDQKEEQTSEKRKQGRRKSKNQKSKS